MAGFSNFLENELLDHILLTGTYTPPELWVALYTSTPDDAGNGIEVSGTNYTRIQHEDWVVSASGATSNNSVVTFPTAGISSWGTVVAFGILDASTDGNLLVWGAVTPNLEVTGFSTASFPVNDLDITLD